MIWRIEVKHRKGVFDALAEGIKKSIVELGFQGVKDVSVTQIYNVEGALALSDVNLVAQELVSG